MMARHLPENIGESDESAAYESDASTNADSDVDSFSYDVAYIQIRVPRQDKADESHESREARSVRRER